MRGSCQYPISVFHFFYNCETKEDSMNKKLPPHSTQQCTRSLLPELFLSLHQLIMLYPRKSYTLGGGLAWFAYFGRSSVFSVQTVNVSYDKVYIEIVVVVGGCDDKYVLLLLDLVSFFAFGHVWKIRLLYFSTMIIILGGGDCWKQAVAAFYSPREALIAFDHGSLATLAEDRPCSLFFLFFFFLVVVL